LPAGDLATEYGFYKKFGLNPFKDIAQETGFPASVVVAAVSAAIQIGIA